MQYLLDVVVAVLAGPLLVAGSAKLITPPAKVAWPIRSGALGAPHGPRLVGAAELAAAAGIVLLPGRASAALAFLSYSVLSAAAHLMRGERCGCFGLARLAVMGNVHVGLNATAAAAALLMTVVGSGSASSPPTGARLAGAVAGALATVGLVLA